MALESLQLQGFRHIMAKEFGLSSYEDYTNICCLKKMIIPRFSIADGNIVEATRWTADTLRQ